MKRLEYPLDRDHKWNGLKLSEPVFAVVVPFNDGYAGIVTTNPATGITKNKATLNGTSNFDAAGFGFNWGETIAYGHQNVESGWAGSHSIQITGLAPNTLYHFQAFAGGETGNAYGEDKTFRTLGGGNPNIDQLIYQHAERMTR